MTTDRTLQEDAYRAADAILAEITVPLDSLSPDLLRAAFAYAWLLGSRDGGEQVLALMREELAQVS